ncbi:MAG: peptidoglycan DD-metalloendopeptidase family protein [Bacteroidales bacterium]|jgi:murein DD-endopeptidase MepM/ murein hydrolase activator NlpD|nr:peptidoglycan DD-metalloendopeptidase family protein [Bacteroidales bacterium]
MRKIKNITLWAIVGVIAVSGAIFGVRKFLLSGGVDYAEPVVPDALVIPEPVLKFGVPVDSFIIQEDAVRNRESLSDILHRYGITQAAIATIASDSVFNVRRLLAGHNYFAFLNGDSTLAYFIYEIDKVDYVMYHFGDSVWSTRHQKPVDRRQLTASGTISSSLWNAMKDNGLNPQLALDMSDIYAWAIDFFGIQKDDSFRVIYEESFVDSVSTNNINILACLFEHAGTAYFAFPFEQDSVVSYYDHNGQSLKKAFLKAPLQYSRISSFFSNSRYHPVLKYYRPHHGIDYAAPAGTPVVSIGDGLVVAKAYQAGGGGNYLKIKHNSVYMTSYMHLRGFAKGIAVGTRVRQGQEIGYVGSTGLATGPHLDFRVYRDGKPINPLKLESPPVEPVSEANMPQFTALRDSLTTLLKNIEIITQ